MAESSWLVNLNHVHGRGRMPRSRRAPPTRPRTVADPGRAPPGAVAVPMPRSVATAPAPIPAARRPALQQRSVPISLAR